MALVILALGVLYTNLLAVRANKKLNYAFDDINCSHEYMNGNNVFSRPRISFPEDLYASILKSHSGGILETFQSQGDGGKSGRMLP
jgi:hypothetical protein